MHRFRRLFNFYVNSSIHVGFAVLALTCITLLKLDILIHTPLLVFIFFGTITAYNFVKYAEVAGLHHRSLARSLKEIQLFSVLCGVGMAISIYWLKLEVIGVCVLLGILTLFYAVPLFNLKLNLRSVSGLKIFVIAIVWSGVTVILPVMQNSGEFAEEIWLLSIQCIFYVLAVMIPFEIRDLKYDATYLKTIPQVVGKSNAKLLGICFTLIFLGISYLLNVRQINLFIIDFFIALLVMVGIAKSSINNDRYFAAFWVEAIPILWLFCEVLSRVMGN